MTFEISVACLNEASGISSGALFFNYTVLLLHRCQLAESFPLGLAPLSARTLFRTEVYLKGQQWRGSFF